MSLKEMQSASIQQQQQKLLEQQGILAGSSTVSPVASAVSPPSSVAVAATGAAVAVQPLTDVHVALETIQPGTLRFMLVLIWTVLFKITEAKPFVTETVIVVQNVHDCIPEHVICHIYMYCTCTYACKFDEIVVLKLQRDE